MGNGAGVANENEKPISPIFDEFVKSHSISGEEFHKYHGNFVEHIEQGNSEIDAVAMLAKAYNEGLTGSECGGQQFPCEICKSTFSTFAALSEHISTCRNPCKKGIVVQLEPIQSSVTENTLTASFSPSRRPSLERPALDNRKSSDSITSSDPSSPLTRKSVFANGNPTATMMTTIHADIERTTGLLNAYFVAHPRRNRTHKHGDEQIFSGSKLLREGDSSLENMMNLDISVIKGPDLTICNIPLVIEIVVADPRHPSFTGKAYLSYEALKSLLGVELSKAADISTEHMLIAQYCISRLSVSRNSSSLRVVVKHNSFSAGDSIEKKLDRLLMVEC